MKEQVDKIRKWRTSVQFNVSIASDDHEMVKVAQYVADAHDNIDTLLTYIDTLEQHIAQLDSEFVGIIAEAVHDVKQQVAEMESDRDYYKTLLGNTIRNITTTV